MPDTAKSGAPAAPSKSTPPPASAPAPAPAARAAAPAAPDGQHFATTSAIGAHVAAPHFEASAFLTRANLPAGG